MKTNSKTSSQPANVLVDILSPAKKLQLDLLIGLWLIGTINFYWWWFKPEHVIDGWRMAFNTIIIFYSTAMPAYYFYFLRKMKKPNTALPIPSEWRIAMITTRAPSEPISVVKQVLLGMIAQDHPHDNWLADEDPSEETAAWCREHGIKLITRRGVAAYHQKSWPRRTKCKEGNLAYWYDNFGYRDYDFVIQLDSDHVPDPDYLRAILPPFNDPKIGYVSAPSVCDSNAKESWATRGRLYLEAALHGTQQAGRNGDWTSMCIGSHYAVRVKALQEAGGLGPELAEDHSTTLLLVAKGWKGVHAIDAIAHGTGPSTFCDAIIQEFQWARSLVMIFLNLTPKMIGKLPWKLKFQFLFDQLWYFVFSYTMLIGFLIPPLALIFGKAWVHIYFQDFLLHSIWPSLACIAIMLWVKKQSLYRPSNGKVLSWEGLLFALARWPWMVYAVLDAFNATYRGRSMVWNVTPKIKGGLQKIKTKMLIPYFALLAISSLILVTHKPTGETIGCYVFTALNILCQLTLLAVVYHRNYAESKVDANLDTNVDARLDEMLSV